MAAKKKIATPYTGDAPRTIKKDMFYKMTLDDEQHVFANAIWNPDIDIIFCNSKAGTGKTTIAVGVANMLVQYKFFDGIIYVMSPYGERKQGWLPGSLTEKSSVYFKGFYQALVNCDINPNTVISDDSSTGMANQKNGSGYIICTTDTFFRGLTLDRAVIIIDESQNYTKSQLKTALTRIGENVKVIVIGHDLQCDLENPELSGFIEYLEHYKGKERAAFCELKINHRGWISQHADELK